MMRKLALLAAAAGIVALAAPIAAQAATTPVARLSLASNQIAPGATARLTYSTSGLPAGSATYLEVRKAGAATWTAFGRPLGASGVITLPGTRSGTYQFRLIVTDGGSQVAASPTVTLTAGSSGTAGASGGGGTESFSWGSVLGALADGAAGVAGGSIVSWLIGLLFA